MSWINDLRKTYDNCHSYVGKEDDLGTILLPIGHIQINAPIQVTIDIDGNFLKVEKIEKDYSKTIIPATEDSASRSSNISPMPLNDKLQYVAGDYGLYIKDAKPKNIETYKKCFAQYLALLKSFASANESDLAIHAVYKYVQKESLTKDIIESNVGIDINDNEFVRFQIFGGPSNYESRTWYNESLFQAWGKYILTLLQNPTNDDDVLTSIDYCTGQQELISSKFPAKIRNPGDKAKLISSNDSNTNSLTFKGRFQTSTEAVSVGYISSQKAFNALQWLIERQGLKNGSEVIVCWSPDGKTVPQINDKAIQLFGFENAKYACSTSELYAENFNKALLGFNSKFKPNDEIVVMSVDTADDSNQGRLAITSYSKITYAAYKNNLLKWYTSGALKLSRFSEKAKRTIQFYGVPSPYDLIATAYGNCNDNGKLETQNKKLEKKAYRRILKCIMEGTPYPIDIMRSSVRNCSNPLRYKSGKYGSAWDELVTNTCVQILKVYKDNRKEIYEMDSSDVKKRSYLLGQLLALADRLEDFANYQNDNSRITSAKRYWSNYVKYPAKTWKVIFEKIQPYFERIRNSNPGTYYFYNSKIEEIMNELNQNNYFTNHPLNENYLLGYYNQLSDLKNYSKEEDKND